MMHVPSDGERTVLQTSMPCRRFLFSKLNAECGTYLPFIQRHDHCDVVELGLSYHCLGELNLCCYVGHRYGVVVVISDV